MPRAPLISLAEARATLENPSLVIRLSSAFGMPVEAVTRELGTVSWGSSGASEFLMGRLRVGEAMSPPLMRAVKRKLEELDPQGAKDVIIDAPPGVSCPAVNAVMDSDVIVLVTEPTPFGLYDLGLAREGWFPVWVIEFPMFEYDEQEKRWVSLHHPFTAPLVDDPALLAAAPGQTRSRAYDMVLNGSEIGGGSIRIHRPEMQSTVFHLLGISDEEAEEKFGFLLQALKYGCPPHGGIAFGLDRIAALMAGEPSIRDVIAFPKTTTAQCPLTDAPSNISNDQLKELHIAVVTKPSNEPALDGKS